MTKVITAPNEFTDDKECLFLAGGITNCPEWQTEIIGLLEGHDLTLLNPRRENFPIHDPDASEIQIGWEHHAMRHASEILFWFCKETLCPIVLYELGCWTMQPKQIYIGMDSEYSRRRDVEIQTRLVRPNIKFAYSLSDLTEQVRTRTNWIESS